MRTPDAGSCSFRLRTPDLEPDLRAALLAVVERAQRLGFAGAATPAPEHLRHARQFLNLEPPPAAAQALDLGSGNGLPGLVLATEWSESRWWLLDASTTRCEFLRWAVAALNLESRVEIVDAAAELAAHDSRFRGKAELVVVKAFGPPAVVAECGAGFLSPGGRLVVSSPPEGGSGRWPSDELAQLGLELSPAGEQLTRLDLLVRTGAFPAEYPRREGVPRRRPLF